MPQKQRQASRTTPGFTVPYKGAAQQGTLFDKRTMPKTGDEQGPRGYSVNRLREVTAATKDVKYGYQGSSEGSPFGVVPQAGRMQTDWWSPGQKQVDPMARGKAKIRDTIARSTMPTEQLKGLTSIHSMGYDDRIAGSYEPGYKSINLHNSGKPEGFSDEMENHPKRTKHPEQRGPINPNDEVTLMHELGHHASNMKKRIQYKTDPQQAREEGRADNAALTHWREDTRSVGHEGGHFDPRAHTYLSRKDPLTQGDLEPEYRKTFGPKSAGLDRPKLPHVAPSQERHSRPILGDSKRVTMEASPFSAVVPKAQTMSIPRGDEPAHAFYKTAAQKATRAGQQKAENEVKGRWGANQPNRNLGQQWQTWGGK